MKTYYKIILAAGSLVLASCSNGNSNSSLNDNSVTQGVNKKEDYSSIEPGKLLKHIQAHYDLAQFKDGKEKLNYLMTVYSDTLNGVDLVSLRDKIDEGLLQEQQEEQTFAEAEAISRLPSSVDKMRRIKDGMATFYYDLSSPQFDTKECFYPYVKKDLYGAHLCFRTRSVGTSWLNMEKVIVTVGQSDHYITGDVTKTETKGKKAYKNELIDYEITTEEQLKTLKSIANGDDVVAIFVGNFDYKKRNITEEQRIAFRNVLDFYTFLYGNKILPMKSEITDSN